jgi:hypothetical protein
MNKILLFVTLFALSPAALLGNKKGLKGLPNSVRRDVRNAPIAKQPAVAAAAVAEMGIERYRAKKGASPRNQKKQKGDFSLV